MALSVLQRMFEQALRTGFMPARPTGARAVGRGSWAVCRPRALPCAILHDSSTQRCTYYSAVTQFVCLGSARPLISSRQACCALPITHRAPAVLLPQAAWAHLTGLGFAIWQHRGAKQRRKPANCLQEQGPQLCQVHLYGSPPALQLGVVGLPRVRTTPCCPCKGTGSLLSAYHPAAAWRAGTQSVRWPASPPQLANSTLRWKELHSPLQHNAGVVRLIIEKGFHSSTRSTTQAPRSVCKQAPPPIEKYKDTEQHASHLLNNSVAEGSQ